MINQVISVDQYVIKSDTCYFSYHNLQDVVVLAAAALHATMHLHSNYLGR